MSNMDMLKDQVILSVKGNNNIKDNSNLNDVISQYVNDLTHALTDSFNNNGAFQTGKSTSGNCCMSLLKFNHFSIKNLMEKGISLNNYLTLIKTFRNAYKSLIENADWTDHNKQIISLFSENCFEELEFGLTQEWIDSVHKQRSQNMVPIRKGLITDRNIYFEIFENIISPIILLDSDNQIINFNLAASCLFTDLKTKTPLYPIGSSTESPFEPMRELLTHFITSELKHFNFETYMNSSKGKRYFKVILKKLTNENGLFSGTITMLEDLTTYKEAEENLKVAKLKAEEADELKTAFLANMSHEIRTPMNAILGFTELMLNSSHSSRERNEFLQLIRKSSNDLLTIIEDIIDIAKMESKQLKIKYKACKPFETLNDLYVLFNETLRRYGIHKDIELILKVEETDQDVLLFTDTERLKQVLSNLLNNAIKFTTRGYIEFGYKLINETSVFFFVRDTGEGIPEEMKSRIFDRFVQLEHHSDKNHRGAGLGLAICKNIINLMGGEIWVESIENKGSEFYFLIPRRNVPKEYLREKLAGKTENIQESELKNRSILIAEDDEINFIYLKEILKNYEVNILHSKNGLETIDIAESTDHIDIILMDIKMPLVDGIEAANYISQIRPEIPIIAQTAFAMNGDEKKCLEAGCCAYITKPVDPQKLLKTILKFISPTETISQTHEIVK